MTKTTNAPPVQGEALEAFTTGGRFPKHNADHHSVQAERISRRFGIALSLAGAVASLAYAEAAQ
jgi:hypothetical protein